VTASLFFLAPRLLFFSSSLPSTQNLPDHFKTLNPRYPGELIPAVSQSTSGDSTRPDLRRLRFAPTLLDPAATPRESARIWGKEFALAASPLPDLLKLLEHPPHGAVGSSGPCSVRSIREGLRRNRRGFGSRAGGRDGRGAPSSRRGGALGRVLLRRVFHRPLRWYVCSPTACGDRALTPWFLYSVRALRVHFLCEFCERARGSGRFSSLFSTHTLGLFVSQ
jgi:hypothetical protein